MVVAKVSLIIKIRGKTMRLKELRNKVGLTQKELANKMNVSGQTILNWESDIYEPNISQLKMLADIFNVSVDYLIEHDNIPTKIDELRLELEKISKEEMLNFIQNELKKNS